MAGQGIVDIRTLVRPPGFDGSEKEWEEWSFAFRSFVGLLELDGLLDSAVGAGALDDDLREKSRLLYHLLVHLLRGKGSRGRADCGKAERCGHVDTSQG